MNHILLQADLTAVAPGYLAPELSETLLLMADAEGQGPASIYRFSASTIRRALDAGQDAESLLAFLREHSATDLPPQPLEYLVQDTASRHGRLRVGTSASFIQSDDETAITDLLREARTSALSLVRIAPPLSSLPLPVRAKRRVSCASWASRLPCRRLNPPSCASNGHGSARQRPPGLYGAPRTAPPDDDVEAQLSVLRQHRAVPTEATGETATQLGLETLQTAIRLKQAVTMNVVDSLGNANTETVVPVSVSGGRVRVFDPAKDTERVLSIHRIIDVEPAGELRS